MARRQLLPWLTVRKWEQNDSFCPPCWRGIVYAVGTWGQNERKTERKKDLYLSRLALEWWQGEGEVDGGHGRAILSALHWQHKRTHHNECKGMFGVKTALSCSQAKIRLVTFTRLLIWTLTHKFTRLFDVQPKRGCGIKLSFKKYWLVTFLFHDKIVQAEEKKGGCLTAESNWQRLMKVKCLIRSYEIYNFVGYCS